MYRVTVFVGDNTEMDRLMEHPPRIGETLRFKGGRMFKIQELVWSFEGRETDYKRIFIQAAPVVINRG